MSKERFEIFGKIIKDNEEVPNLLDNYLATVRLNELNDKLKELEQELAEIKEKAIVPKFKIGQEVWAISIYRLNCVDSFIITEIGYCANYGLFYKTNMGINLYEYYYLIFATEQEAQEKLKEMKGNE